MEKINLFIENLECGSCASGIEKVLAPYKKDKVLDFSIILTSKKVKITFDESKISKNEILNKLNEKKFVFKEI